MDRIPDVRIGVVSYDTPDDLRACLDTIAQAVAGMNAEVVVVDNGSATPKDAEVAGQTPYRVLRIRDNVGYPRAMNVALADTRAPVLLALNPDTVLTPGSLTRLVQTMLDDDSIGLVSPRISNNDGTLQHSIRAFPSPATALTTGLLPPALRRHLPREPYWLSEYPEPTTAVEVDWTVGVVHVIRRSAIGSDKPYSERSFMYGEDMDLCWRVHRAGWRVVYDPSVNVAHIGNVTGARDFGGSREFRWLDATYDWYVEQKGPAATRAWALANVTGLAAKHEVLRMSKAREHRAVVASLLGFHAARVRRPLGDLHSRAASNGIAPVAPHVFYDSQVPSENGTQ